MAENTNTTQTQKKTNGKWSQTGGQRAQGREQSQGTQSQSSRGEGIQDQISEQAQQMMGSVSEKAGQYAETAAEYMRGMSADPGRFIRQYPIQAAIGGLAIGFLLGAAVSRRSVVSDD